MITIVPALRQIWEQSCGYFRDTGLAYEADLETRAETTMAGEIVLINREPHEVFRTDLHRELDRRFAVQTTQTHAGGAPGFFVDASRTTAVAQLRLVHAISDESVLKTIGYGSTPVSY